MKPKLTINDIWKYALDLEKLFKYTNISLYYRMNRSIHIYINDKFMTIHKKNAGLYRIVEDNKDIMVSQNECMDRIFLFMTKE